MWVYRDKGWKGWADWLGSSKALHKGKWMSFVESREYVRALGLRNQVEYRRVKAELDNTLPRIPSNIPSTPQRVYKDSGWISWGDWLGTGRIAHTHRKFLPFEEAREYIRSLNLKNWSDWFNFTRISLPDFIPKNPKRTYSNQWVSMSDWLGSELEKRDGWLPYDEAREVIRDLSISSQSEWNKFVKQNKDFLIKTNIPLSPASVYRNKGWVSWMDWLGKDEIYVFHWRDFKSARSFARSLGFRNVKQWQDYCQVRIQGQSKKPHDIPSAPNTVYNSYGWKGWGNWLGTGYVANQQRSYISFEEAGDFVRSLELKSREEWEKYCKGMIPNKVKKPDRIPVSVDKIYKNKGWKGWPDFLGYEPKRKKK